MSARVRISALLGVALVAAGWLQAAPAVAATCAAAPLSSSQEGHVLKVLVEMHEQCEPTLELHLAGNRTDFEMVRAEGSWDRLVIAVENSESLAAGDHDLVVNAIRSLLRRIDDSTEVALVSYGSRASLEVPATTEHDLVIQRLQDLEPAGGAALYSGVAEAARAAQGAAGPAAIILFTYGWDWGEGSTEDATASLEALELSGAPLYVQSLVPAEDDVWYLSQLSAAGTIYRGRDLPQIEQALELLVSPEPRLYELTIDVGDASTGDHVLRLETGADAASTLTVSIEGARPTSRFAPEPLDPASASAAEIPTVELSPRSPLISEAAEPVPSEALHVTAESARPTRIEQIAGAVPQLSLEDVQTPVFMLLFLAFASHRWRRGRERREDEAISRTRRARYHEWLIAA